MLIFPSMYQSTIFGTSVRPLAPPKAVPFHTRPVTSWNGLVEISWPAPATPMMTLTPQPRWQHSSACRIVADIADALEAVIGAALGQVDEIGDEVALDLVRVDEMGHAEFLGQCPLAGVEIDADDHVGADHAAALHDIEPDAAEAEDHDIGAGLDLGGVDHRANAGGDAAADVADLVERRVLADFRDRDLGQYREVREGRGAHVVVDLIAAEREPAGAVGHHALALRRADRDAEIGLARQAVFALPAFGGVERDDVVALGDARHPAPDIDDDAGAFMAEDRREQPLGIGPGQRVLVGMADPGRLDLDQHLAFFGAVEPHRLDRQRLSGLVGDGGARFHNRLPRMGLIGWYRT